MTKPLAYLLAFLLLVIGGAAYTAHQRQVGALRFQLHAADSTHEAALKAAAQATKAAEAASAQADTLRAKAQAEARKDAVIRAKTDSALRHSSEERDHATSLLGDSLATLSQFRAEVSRLLVSGAGDSASYDQERRAHLRTVNALLGALAADSTALTLAKASAAALTKRAEASEKTVALMQRDRPSTFWKWGERLAWAGAVVYLAGRK